MPGAREQAWTLRRLRPHSNDQQKFGPVSETPASQCTALCMILGGLRNCDDFCSRRTVPGGHHVLSIPPRAWCHAYTGDSDAFNTVRCHASLSLRVTDTLLAGCGRASSTCVWRTSSSSTEPSQSWTYGCQTPPRRCGPRLLAETALLACCRGERPLRHSPPARRTSCSTCRRPWRSCAGRCTVAGASWCTARPACHAARRRGPLLRLSTRAALAPRSTHAPVRRRRRWSRRT